LNIVSGEGETVGISCINIDISCLTEFRAYIRHLSIKDKSLFKQALLLTIDFIWRFMNPDTIRLDLHHYADSEVPSNTLQANSEIKNILMMEKKGFKWKTLINDQSGRRYQVM
jgi:hypothetical protein